MGIVKEPDKLLQICDTSTYMSFVLFSLSIFPSPFLSFGRFKFGGSERL